MSDSDFVDVGDELVVRIAGCPVGKARITYVSEKGAVASLISRHSGDYIAEFYLPLDFKNYDVTDGVAHRETVG